MKKRNIRLALCISALLSSNAYVFADSTNGSPIPNAAVGTWVYNTTWPSTRSGAMPWDKAADIDDLWVNSISCYNGDSTACQQTIEPATPGGSDTPQSPNTNNNPITEIIYYGGDLESYCGGTGQGPWPIQAPPLWACAPNAFYTSYYGPYMGMMKIGDPSVDTSKIMVQDIAKWVALHPNTFTLHSTCDNFDGVGCTVSNPATSNVTGFWDNYVAGDLAARGPQFQAHTTSGFRSGAEYANVYVPSSTGRTKPALVADIDGRMDIVDHNDDFLDGLNTMQSTDAAHLADFIAKNICADDNPDGVQFDLEPFTFDSPLPGPNGVPFPGTGQQPFYTEIAKDFAGYYGNRTDPSGINNIPDAHGEYSDPLHCVDRAHPNGRFFSVFTFSGNVKPLVVTVFTHHNNGMIVDSLYDLTTSPPTIVAAAALANQARAAAGEPPITYTTTAEPGGYPTCPTTDVTVPAGTYPAYKYLVQAEITAMSKLKVPFQFGVPVGASAHEFESRQEYAADGTKGALITTFGAGNDCANEPGTPNQGSYVTQVLAAIQSSGVTSNSYYKGIDVYGWSQQSWWTDVSTPNAAYYELMPDYPNTASLTALGAGPSAAPTSSGYSGY